MEALNLDKDRIVSSGAENINADYLRVPFIYIDGAIAVRFIAHDQLAPYGVRFVDTLPDKLLGQRRAGNDSMACKIGNIFNWTKVRCARDVMGPQVLFVA